MREINNIVVSLIRTICPMLVGQIMTWLAAIGVLDATGEISAQLIASFTLLFTTLYYALVRVLETKLSPKWGWLLGAAKAPEYKG